MLLLIKYYDPQETHYTHYTSHNTTHMHTAVEPFPGDTLQVITATIRHNNTMDQAASKRNAHVPLVET